MRAFFIAVLLLTSGAYPASAASYQVTVTKVIDGDTFEIDTPWMLFKELTFRVRVRNLDTPEKGQRAQCAIEAARAELATQRTRALIQESDNTVTITNLGHDKYGGRIDADVHLPDGRRLADELVNDGLARHYTGGKREGWCR